MMTKQNYLVCFLILLMGSSLMAENWSSFRGSDGTAVSQENGLPLQWSQEHHLKWKVSLPGKGTSSPIVHGKRVVVTTQVDDQDLHVMLFDLEEGDLIWDRKVGRGRLPTHELHNMATPTPITDGHHVWAFFGTGDLVCLALDNGEEVWRRNLRREYADYNTN
ncbi:MAG: pyrrolo-quinoline quinone, partial [Verrucomicrobia bacterium]|nr:pyrrolo-quinoline quinone [Verrucomicrobiota bacterium]